MALFAFGSGYFFKYKNLDNKKQYILKKVKALLIPLFLWNCFYLCYIKLLSYFGFTIGLRTSIKIPLWQELVNDLLIQPVLSGHQYVYNMGGWFVIPLFQIEILNLFFKSLLKKLNISKNHLSFLLILILGFWSIHLSQEGLTSLKYLWGLRLLYLYPFYELGILYRRKLEAIDTLCNLKYFGIIFIIQLGIITLHRGTIAYTPSWCNDFSDALWTPFLIGFMGIAFWLRISKLLVPVLKNSKVVLFIANSTYYIMIHHFLGFMSIKTIFAFLNYFIGLFPDFNWIEYKTNIWYYYLPFGLSQWLILYVIAGLSVPVLIKYIVSIFRSILKRMVLRARRKKAVSYSQ